MTALVAGLLVFVAAQPTPPAPDPAMLVKRLGAASFEAREQAEADLTALGLAARPALEAGTRDPDPEIRARCLRLLGAVHEADRKARVAAFLGDTEGRTPATLPGWERFRALGGAATRPAFAAVYTADPVLLDLAAKEPQQVAAQVAERTRDLAVRLLTPERDRAALAALPALLFVVADPAVPLDPATLKALYAGLRILAEREALCADFRKQAAAPELLLAALQRGGEASQPITLPLAGDLGLPGAKAWGVKVATTAAAPGPARARAVLLVARLGGPGDVPTLAPLLTEKVAVGSTTVGGKRLNAELGDVALAATTHLRGEKPADYGFPYFQVVPGLKTLPTPERLGFADAAGRAAAFDRWRQKSRLDNP